MNNCIYFEVLQPNETRLVEPAGYDLAATKEKGLAKASIYDESYLAIQSAYLALLNLYLCSTEDLDTFQAQLDDSGMEFSSYEPQTIYHKRGSFGRQNISIRNTPYIERLERSDISCIEQAIIEDGDRGRAIKSSSELLDLIRRTWQDVIEVRIDPNSASPYEIRYDEDSMNGQTCMSNALTFELSYRFDYDPSGNIIDDALEASKLDYATSTIQRMEKQLSQNLDCPVKVFLKVS